MAQLPLLSTPSQSPHLLNQVEQLEIGALLSKTLGDWLAARGRSPLAGVYVLTSLTWGEARRVGWSTRELAEYAMKAWAACQAHAKGSRFR
jgi:hypothetical protein